MKPMNLNMYSFFNIQTCYSFFSLWYINLITRDFALILV